MTTICADQIRFTYKNENYVIENFSLNDSKVTKNLQKLFERRKGTLFRVNEEGELFEIKKWKDEFDYKWDQEKENVKIRKVVNAALIQFDDFLSRMEDRKVAEAAVKYLFSKTGKRGIGRCGKTLYNRKLLKCDNVISQYLISPNTVRLKLSDHKFVDVTNDKFAKQIKIPFILNFDLGNEVLNHNCWMLLKRKKGQIYQVNGEGKLEKVKTLIKCHLNRAHHKAEVQAVVTSVIKNLNIFLTKITMTEIHQLIISQIFSTNSALCRMNQATFNRDRIEEGSLLEKILHPKLEEKRSALVKALIEMRDVNNEKKKNAAKHHLEDVFMDLVFEEFTFTKELGIRLERNRDGGSGGARYGRSRFGRKILVVKPEDEGPFGINNPQWYARLKRFIFSVKPCLRGNPEPISEYDSWDWDRTFNIWSVPPTDVRYISSSNFTGYSYKQCSVQIYVEGCKTLGKYVNIFPSIQWLPRSFLRWYSGSRFNTSCFYSFGQREDAKQCLLEKLPINLLTRVAIHNFNIEDIDCHFENILVKKTDIPSGNSLLDRIFRSDLSVTDEEIKSFVEHFFKSNGTQEILQQLLYSEEVTIGNEKKRIFLIKHDGGASNPRIHPGKREFLSLRYKHLFEVLPHFEEPFTPASKQLIAEKQDIFAKFLLEKGARNLCNILTTAAFEAFWSDKKNRVLLRKWIFEVDENVEYALRLQLIGNLFIATKQNAQQVRYWDHYFRYHLERIRSGLQTRIDSFRVLLKYVQSDKYVMRTVFKNVKCDKDFKRELESLDDGFYTLMEQWKMKPVKNGQIPKKSKEDISDIFKRHYLLEWFGEEV